MDYDYIYQQIIKTTPDYSKLMTAEDFIQYLAEATAKENAKALRTSPSIFDKVLNALACLCGNRTYNTSSDEDTMNDYIRDLLDKSLEIRDQTRQGISSKSTNAEKGRAGELDIQIRFNGIPIGIYEGLRLESVEEKIIHDHIEKATIKYNPQGCKEVFIVTYVIKQKKGFGEYWKRFVECVNRYKQEDDEYNIKSIEEIDTSMSAIRALHGKYYMDEMEHNVYIIAVKIQE